MMSQMGTITPSGPNLKIFHKNKVTLDDIRKIEQHTDIFQEDPKRVLANVKYISVHAYSQDIESGKLDIMWEIKMHVSQPYVH